MRFLIFWDIYWRIWRNAIKKEFDNLKKTYSPDFIIANIENITSWRWPIEKHLLEIEKLWVDIMTWWDHIFDNLKNIKSYLESEKSKLIRPANFYESEDLKLPWKWYKIIEKDWKRILIIHLLWQIFMKNNVDNPFFKLKELINQLKWKYDIWILDFHKEATSEIYWLWLYIQDELKNDKISLLFWTHSHIQTNDEFILENWTWFICDVWMSGAEYSVIWADFWSVKKRFLSWIQQWKIEQSLDKRYLVNALFAEIDEETWKCKKVEKIKIKWVL